MMKKISFKIDDDSFVTLDPINARVVKLLCKKKYKAKLHKKGDNITKVEFNDISFEIGKQIHLKQPFKVFSIQEIEDGFFLHACELSKSSYFILPVLGEDRAYFWWNSLFTNCYVDVEDIKYKLCGPHIYLLYRFSGQRFYQDFETKLEDNPHYVKTFDVDPYQVMYVFSIPEEYHENFNFFRKGKYSKLDNSYKERIIDFHSAPYDSELSQILFKAPQRREKLKKDLLVHISESAELYDIPRMCTETFYNRYLIKNSIQPSVKFGKVKEKV